MPATTFRLLVWTRFLAPVDAVWRLKTTGARLAEEFPWWMRFRIAEADVLQEAFDRCEACEVQGTLGFGISWPLRLEAVEPSRRYRDCSENLLYRRFEHEHRFEPTSDGCRYVDDVVFEPAGPLPRATALSTRWLFERRHRAAARHLPVDSQSLGTSVLRVLIEEED